MPPTPAVSATPRRVQLFTAVATGLATTAYYATPDLISSRRARGWAKTGLAVASAAASIPAIRAELAAARAAVSQAADATDSGAATESDAEFSARGKAVAAALGGVALLGSVAGIVAGEKWMFRRGEARAAAGKPLPHTGPALVLGALTAALSFLPLPAPRNDTGR